MFPRPSWWYKKSKINHFVLRSWIISLKIEGILLFDEIMKIVKFFPIIMCCTWNCECFISNIMNKMERATFGFVVNHLRSFEFYLFICAINWKLSWLMTVENFLLLYFKSNALFNAEIVWMNNKQERLVTQQHPFYQISFIILEADESRSSDFEFFHVCRCSTTFSVLIELYCAMCVMYVYVMRDSCRLYVWKRIKCVKYRLNTGTTPFILLLVNHFQNLYSEFIRIWIIGSGTIFLIWLAKLSKNNSRFHFKVIVSNHNTTMVMSMLANK